MYISLLFWYDVGMKACVSQAHNYHESWYHHRWFRILLIIVSIDMIFLGATFALGLNVLVIFEGVVSTVARAIIGILYIIVASYILSHATSYKRFVDTHNIKQHGDS